MHKFHKKSKVLRFSSNLVGMLTSPFLIHRTSFSSIRGILNATFYKSKTCQFLRKFTGITVIMTAMTYPQIKFLSLLFTEILTINSFIL